MHSIHCIRCTSGNYFGCKYIVSTTERGVELSISSILSYLQVFIAVKAITTPYPEIIRHNDENYFFDPATQTKEKFPSIDDSPTIALSVIVPAYEEQQRCKKLKKKNYKISI